MSINNPDDWKYVATNKYGSGLVITATYYDAGEVDLEFEIDISDPTGSFIRSISSPKIPDQVVDRAVDSFNDSKALLGEFQDLINEQ